MISLKHPFCNKRLTPPASMTENECRTLHVYQELPTEESPFPAVSSFWTPEPDELAALNAGGSVMLRIIGTTHPPLSMRVSPQHDDAQPSLGYVPFIMTSDEFHAICEEVVKLRADKARLATHLPQLQGAAVSEPPSSIIGTIIEAGDDADGQPRMTIHITREELLQCSSMPLYQKSRITFESITS